MEVNVLLPALMVHISMVPHALPVPLLAQLALEPLIDAQLAHLVNMHTTINASLNAPQLLLMVSAPESALTDHI